MQCQYCDSHITPYPKNGLCPNCGAILPPDDAPKPQARPVFVQQPAFIPQPGINCCGRCGSTAISFKKRGFGWAAGLIGFFFLPPFGLLFGLIGRKKLKYRCSACGHKWERL